METVELSHKRPCCWWTLWWWGCLKKAAVLERLLMLWVRYTTACWLALTCFSFYSFPCCIWWAVLKSVRLDPSVHTSRPGPLGRRHDWAMMEDNRRAGLYLCRPLADTGVSSMLFYSSGEYEQCLPPAAKTFYGSVCQTWNSRERTEPPFSVWRSPWNGNENNGLTGELHINLTTKIISE